MCKRLAFKTTSALMVALAAAMSAIVVYASCITPPEEGYWRNSNPYTQSLTRVQVRFVCQDQILNGKPYPPGAPFYIRLFGKCYPSDCDWGEIPAKIKTVNGTEYIYGVYRQGYATRYVYIKMSAYRTGQLWVWMYTDFYSSYRTDYASQNWFTRQ